MVTNWAARTSGLPDAAPLGAAMITPARTSGLTVLVCGATGRLAALAGLLVGRGHRVLAASRDPASLPARRLHQAGAHLVRADFDDPASLQAAAAGR